MSAMIQSRSKGEASSGTAFDNADRRVSRIYTKASDGELTSGRVFKLLLLSTGVWYAVAQFIRYGGAAGSFSGARARRTYIATFVMTMPLNWAVRKLVGLPAEKMLSVAALSVIVPPILEGIVMRWFPQVYGGDPVVIGAGAVWLLFAIGSGLGLAAVTTLRASKRLKAGDAAPVIVTQNVEGGLVRVPNAEAQFIHVQFLRFAGCPVCNLQLQPYIKRHAELRAAGIQEVIFFHSEARYIKAYHRPFPFDAVADPGREHYRRYRVERSVWAVLSPIAWPNLILGYSRKLGGKIDNSIAGLPAEFLVDASGTILASHYGDHASDQWAIDEVLALVHGRSEAGLQSLPQADEYV